MPIFNIITTIDTGKIEVLSYSSENHILFGQIVSVLVRNKPYLGICITKNEADISDQSGGVSVWSKDIEIKPVTEILPIVLPTKTMDLIFKSQIFSWNKLSSISGAVLQPFSYILKKLSKIVENYQDEFNTSKIDLNIRLSAYLDSTNPSTSNTKFSIHHDSDIVLRIMYLIRNKVMNLLDGGLDISGQILILFPDVATLFSLSDKLKESIKQLATELDQEIFTDFYYSENSIVSNRQTVTNLLVSKKLQIVFSTRSGIFLPFWRLIQTFLIEESNNNYIQEQNTLYFDCRDFSYILSQIWGCDLNWVSTFPSSRSLAFHFETQDSTKSIEKNEKEINLRAVRIHEKNNLHDNNHIFSNQTEQLVEQLDGPILFIHPRRGNFRITQCHQCRYIWYCTNCTSPLTAYKINSNDGVPIRNKLELLCHHCQSKFSYPLFCPACNENQITSYKSGIEDLEEYLIKNYQTVSIHQIDTSKPKKFAEFENLLTQATKQSQRSFFLTTKIYDPRIPYSLFKSIVVIQAENLTTGVDYLTTEEVYLAIFSLFSKIILSQQIPNTSLVFDTTNPDLEILQKFLKLNREQQNYHTLLNLYSFYIKQELAIRQKFKLPPYHNLLVLSLSGKKQENVKEQAQVLYNWINQNTAEIRPELILVPPHPAKLFKRKGYYTYHLLLKYPKQFKHLKTLEHLLKDKINDLRLKVRLNPRHLF